MTGSPYKGLAAFDDSAQDVAVFFGREGETEVICANLMASRLTVLYGETGVGKSSILRAGVAHEMRRTVGAHAVVVFDNWKDDPAAGLNAAVSEAAGVEPSGTLADTLEAGAAQLGGDLFVVLDGFEEYFLYHEDEEGAGTFLEQFPEAIRRRGLRASFLLALREDALARIDRFKASIPSLFSNYLRLDHLDRAAAREAIVRPIERYNELVGADARVSVEPELVESVLDQVAAGKVALGHAGRGAVGEADVVEEGRIEAPFLQLVMERLWEAERDAGSRTLRRSTLDELGGGERIVRTHLDRALGSLTPEQRDIASSVLNHLVTPTGAKIAHADPDLASYAGVDEAELQPILATLTDERILRPVASDGGSPRHEMYHDVLGEAVLAWRIGHETERELVRERQAAARRHRRMLAALVGGAALLAVMAGVTAYAVSQRSEARTQAREARGQARKAQARQLEASALSLLATDPSVGLALAAEAARLAPSEQAEQVLRTTFLAARERGVLPATGPVSAARWSPDGARVIVASQDGHGRIYDAGTHKILRTLDHGSPVLDAAFDRAGRYAVTGGVDGTARLWDSVTGKRARSFAHGAPVRSVAIDATRSRIATGGGRKVSLWRPDATRVTEIRRPKPVTAVSFNDDGTRLAVVSNDRIVGVYDGTDGRLLDSYDQGGIATSAEFSGGGARLLVTTGANGTARIWRLRDGALLHELKGHRGSVLDAAFSPKASRIATASADGTGRIWDVRTGALVASLVGHKGIVRSIAFSRDGNFVVTGSDDKTARVSKADNGDARAWLIGHGDVVRSVAFSPDGSTVLTGSADRTARLWDARTQPQLGVIARFRAPIPAATYAGPDDIAIAGPGNRVRVVDAVRGRPLSSHVLSGPARAVASSRDGAVVAGAGGHGVVVFRPGGRRTDLPLPGAAAVAISADGSLVVGGGSRGVGRVWSADGRLRHALRGHTGPITDAAFSNDGARIATSSLDGTARVWDVATGRALRTLAGRKGLLSVAFSPDGDAVLTAGLDHTARVWDVATGELLQVLRWHFGRVADASFSPDGRWIVTAGPVTVGLWARGIPEPILPYGFGGHEPLVTSASFDPASRFVLSTSTDGTVRRARCALCTDLDGLLSRARAQLATTGRRLTPEERERYGLD